MNIRKYIYIHSRHPGFLAVISIFILLICVCTFETSAKTSSFDYSLVLDSSQLYEVTEVGGDGETYSKIHWNDMIPEGEPGAPELPVKYLKFFVPTYCKDISVKLKSATASRTFEMSYPVYPAQEPQPTNGKETVWTLPANTLYNQSVNSPSLTVCGESFLDGFNHVVTVAVRPIAYSGENNTLTAYDDITFSISYTECRVEEMATKPIIPKQYRPLYSLDNNIIDLLGLRQSNVRKFVSAPAKPDPSSEYYYVITPESLKTAMSDFVTWKSQKGYIVVEKTIESILADPEFSVCDTIEDEAASLRAYLKKEYSEHGRFYCLLVGNYKTTMPIRKLESWFGSKNYGNDHAEGIVPSDLYFTDLISNYPLYKGNGLSIYCASVIYDFSPSIEVGRLLCSAPEEIENWFHKLKLYEANPGYGDNEYLGNAHFFEQYTPPTLGFIGETNIIREMLSSHFDNIVYRPDERYEDNKKKGPTGATLISEISKVGLSSWHGHGNPAGIAVAYGGNYITSEDSVYQLIRPMDSSLKINEDGNGIDNLTNYNKPAVVYSISCDNNPFDYVVFSNGYTWKCRYNLGEAFTVANKETGGPLFLGNTREGFVKYSAEMEADFFEGILRYKKVGSAENYSKKKYSDSHLSATHSIIGDPEMELWLGKPKELGVDVLYYNNKVELTGEQLAEATVSFYDGSGHSFSSKVDSNKARFSLSDLPGGFDTRSVVVSVWKSGYLPVIKLFGENATETDSKKFVVREADLGYSVLHSFPAEYIIGSGGKVDVKAIDKISLRKHLSVEEGGIARLECDNDILLEGGTVKSGGELNATGKTIVINDGLTVEKSGSLTLNPIQ